MEEYQKAIKYSEKGLEISTVIDNQSGIASMNGSLGNAYRYLGEYQKAIKYNESLEITTVIGNQSNIAASNCNLGLVYLCLGEHKKAIISKRA